MSSTPRARSTCSVGAAIENGTLSTVSSRFMAVTTTSALSAACRVKSSWLVPPPPSSTDCVTVRKPSSEAVTLTVPGGMDTE